MPDFVSPITLLALVALGAYLLGSIPFGMVIARLMGLGNLREIGSGNIGATNVLRTGNKGAALLTLILDGGKGAAAVLAARVLVGEDAAQVAGLASFLGHLFPVWLKFRGGKGVATFLGVALALHFPLGLIAGASWLFVAFVFRISSLSALVAAALAPFAAFFLGRGDTFSLLVILAVLVFVRHHENIRRILAGTEPMIGRKKN